MSSGCLNNLRRTSKKIDEMKANYHYEFRGMDNSLGRSGGKTTPWCRHQKDVFNYGLRPAFMVIQKRRVYN